MLLTYWIVIVYYTLLHEFRLYKQTGGRSTSRLATTLTQGNLVYTLTLLGQLIIDIIRHGSTSYK